MNDIKQALEKALPQAPVRFVMAMEQTTEEIKKMEALKRVRIRYIVVIAAALALFGGVALAVGGVDVFNFFSTDIREEYLAVGQGAYSLRSENLAAYSFSEVDVCIREAVYDGEYLRVMYATRERAATAPFDDETVRQSADFAFPAADRDNIQYRTLDYALINGENVNPLGITGMRAGEQPGELLTYVQFDMTETDEEKGDSFTVALPICGRVQDTPAELTFTVSTRLDGVADHPLPAPQTLGGMTLTLTKFRSTPLALYLDVQVMGTPETTAEEMNAMETLLWNMRVAAGDQTALLCKESAMGYINTEFTIDENGNAAQQPVAGKAPGLVKHMELVPLDEYPAQLTLLLCEEEGRDPLYVVDLPTSQPVNQ